jgi:ectoine hydroxylase-related dioxygenase (phytanoyl-CoA dioxygenase family)
MTSTLDELMTQRPQADFPVLITDAQLAEFRERGFVRIGRITSDDELVWLGEVYDRLFEERVQTVPGGYFDLTRPYDSAGEDHQPQIIMPEARYRELRKTAFYRNGRTIAAQLLGVESTNLRGWGHMIRKPAITGGPLPWHQDEAYWDPAFDYVALGCWMPLDPATVESGCMSFIPGSHRGDVRKHRHLGDDPAVHALVVEDVDTSAGVPVPVEAGGAVFHHCRILHCSGANRSTRVRRAYANEWQLEPVRRETALPERPWITEGKLAWEHRAIKGE